MIKLLLFLKVSSKKAHGLILSIKILKRECLLCLGLTSVTWMHLLLISYLETQQKKQQTKNLNKKMKHKLSNLLIDLSLRGTLAYMTWRDWIATQKILLTSTWLWTLFPPLLSFILCRKLFQKVVLICHMYSQLHL